MNKKEQRLRELQAELAELRKELEPLAMRMFDIEKRQDQIIAELLTLQPYAKGESGEH